MTRFWRVFYILSLLGGVDSARAQEGAILGRIRRGTIASLSSSAETLALKESDGVVRAYLLSHRTFFRKRREEALLQDFRAGEPVVVQMRLSRDSSVCEALGVMDDDSYRWLAYLRRTVLYAPIVAFEENRLVLQVKGRPVRYLADEKTRWYFKGREVGKQTFQVGDYIWVYPESLTRGEILARAASDARDALNAPTLSDEYNARGVLRELDMQVGYARLRLQNGEERVWRFVSAPEMRQRSKAASLAQIQAAIAEKLPVCLRLRRYPRLDYVVRITIEKTERRPKTKTQGEKKL